MSSSASRENVDAPSRAETLGFDREDRQTLARLFAEDVQTLCRFLGKPIEEWKSMFLTK
jgi:hypothetical protein